MTLSPRLGHAGLYGTNGPAMLCMSWMFVICVCKLKDYIIHREIGVVMCNMCVKMIEI